MNPMQPAVPSVIITHQSRPLPPNHQGKILSNNKNASIMIKNQTVMNQLYHAPARATSERIPTTTWGPFTIIVVCFLIILTCLIINCGRIRRKVEEKKNGKSGPLSFEKRHKDLQEADLEWNHHPPVVFTSADDTLLATPESSYSKQSFISSTTNWSSTNSVMTVAQKHHYQDKNFIKNQPPSIQLRLTLENASLSSISPSLQSTKKSIAFTDLSSQHSSIISTSSSSMTSNASTSKALPKVPNIEKTFNYYYNTDTFQKISKDPHQP